MFKNMTGNPFPGDGPYTLKLVNPSPTNGEYILTKNPKFDIPTVAKGYLDQIDGMVSTNVNTMTENVINGTYDYMTEDPVGDLLPQVESQYKDRFLIGPGYPNTYYFFLNSTVPPFNKLAARQAVNYAIDPAALQRIFGGRLHPTCNLLPPGMVGYRRSRRARGGPTGRLSCQGSGAREVRRPDREPRSRCGRTPRTRGRRSAPTWRRCSTRSGSRRRSSPQPDGLLLDDRRSEEQGPDRIRPTGSRTSPIQGTSWATC